MADTTVTLDDDLLRIYSRETLYEPCERSQTRFWDDMEEADDVAPLGAGLFFRIIGASSHSQGNPAEGGDWSAARVRLQVQCQVTSSQIDSVAEISMKFLAASRDGGSFGGDAEHTALLDTTKGLFSYADRLLGVGHGTGRLAVVDSNTVASDTFVCRNPERAFQLRPNQPVDFVNTDTGGTVQASSIIESINYSTGTVVLQDTVTLTAGWGVYQADVYGNPMPNGLRSIVDDGDFATTIFGVSRASPNTFLNAFVMDNGGSLQDYSEELVRRLLDQITFSQDKIPTQLRSNMGIVNEHYRVTTPDRVFNQNGAQLPTYNSGGNHEQLSFTYGTVKITWKHDRNLPARELYALYMPGFKKHTLRKADWVKGKNGSVLQLKPSGETYAYSFLAAQMMDMTISCRCLNSNGKLSWIRDRSAAGDS